MTREMAAEWTSFWYRVSMTDSFHFPHSRYVHALRYAQDEGPKFPMEGQMVR